MNDVNESLNLTSENKGITQFTGSLLNSQANPVVAKTQNVINELFQSDIISATDRYFALHIVSYFCSEMQQREELELLAMLSALVSNQLGKQHTCIDLFDIGQPFLPVYQFPEGATLQTMTLKLGLHVQSDETSLTALQQQLLIDNQRLYLHRYWQYEKQVYAFLKERTQNNVPIENADLADILKTMQNESSSKSRIDWQMVAVFAACQQSFSIITGGPGTGKTTTVAKLISALAKLSAEQLNIKLVAPTGKAAARLTESLQSARERLPSFQSAPDVKIDCSTIHRLLGVIPGKHSFKHNSSYPILADVLIVDEASMIDLPLLAKLLDAIPKTCKVIFLGDANQLASVEVGCVFSDMCAVKNEFPMYTDTFSQSVKEVLGYDLASDSIADTRGDLHQADGSCHKLFIPPFRDHIVELRHSHRFDANSGVGKLAHAVNTGDVAAVRSLLRHDHGYSDIDWRAQWDMNQLWELIALHFRQYFDAISEQDYKQAFAILKQLQILSVTRKGEAGVDNMNSQIEVFLRQHLGVDIEQVYYPGRPVMMTANDHNYGLYNGDIGICGVNEHLTQVVYFEREGDITSFLPAQLPSHESVYAMTIHKSQGSEFGHVIVVLPTRKGRVAQMLNRELLYTGITRAKHNVSLLAGETLMLAATEQRCLRASGLATRLIK